MKIRYVNPKYTYKNLNLIIYDGYIDLGYWDTVTDEMVIVRQNNVFLTFYVLLHEILHYVICKGTPNFYFTKRIHKYWITHALNNLIDKYLIVYRKEVKYNQLIKGGDIR